MVFKIIVAAIAVVLVATVIFILLGAFVTLTRKLFFNKKKKR